LRRLRLRRANAAGFSLVEVALAVGIAGFALVSLLGLLPIGLNTFRTAMDTSVCAQIAQRVFNDAQQAEFALLIDEKETATKPPGYTFRAPGRAAADDGTKTPVRFFDDQGVEVIPKNPGNLSAEERSRILYHVNVRVMPQSRVPDQKEDQFAPDLATITVEVANNPGNIDIPVSSEDPADVDAPDRNLFQRQPGMTILTYSAAIGRN
jgi:uncharacterized protein (TIGR02598 family)